MNEGGVGAAGARTAPDIHENQEALSVATDADGRFGLWGGRDFRESDSEPDESDSDDSE